MRTTLYIISDIHLGGAAGPEGAPGFQMCPPRNQAALAGFVEALPGRKENEDVRLVIAGDLVDFLAEEGFKPFTLNEDEACAKFDRIVEGARAVFDALQAFVGRGGALTLLLGNHDLELSLPRVRRKLLDTLSAGRVEFVYDNEAWSFGPVLIEHGNRYDEWNAVAHGALRRARSQLSRQLKAGLFDAPPGSHLVAEVINRLKADYSFVDLLKPETAGTLPILAALGSGSLRDVWKLAQRYRQTYGVDYDESREPRDETYIAAPDNSDQAMFDLAEDIAAGGDATRVSFVTGMLTGARNAVSEAVRDYRRRALFRALRSRAQAHRLAFSAGDEMAIYETPAKRAAAAGSEVVIYGHTHLAKRIPLRAEGNDRAVYFNTGTWADLIKVPPAVWDKDENSAFAGLREFVTDLERDDVARWRRPAPTFARVVLDDASRIESADICFADGDANEPVTTEGLAKRLAPAAAGGE